MNKYRFLSAIIVLLLFINIALLAFLFSGKPNKKPIMPREIIIDKLHFDDNQIVQYNQLIKKHQQEIIKLDDSIFKVKGKLYQNLNREEQPNDILIGEISNMQAQVEKVHYLHLLEIKKLCRKEQLKNYSELTQNFSTIFSKMPSKHHDNR